MATQTSSNDAPVVQITNDQITTTSTDLAKHFDKRHYNILRKIENLECSA
jgi:phage regulator Rha-like protein